MGKKIKKCPRCGTKKIYNVRRGKVLCSNCRYEWQPEKLPLRLNRRQWHNILHYFILGLSSNKITQETGIERKRVLRALRVARKTMADDTVEMFKGTVEVDETYLGGQWKNKRHNYRKIGSKRGRGTSKTPVFGILCRGGKVWAQIVADTKAKTLLALIEGQVEKGSTICSDTWKAYTGIAYRGYVHRMVKHGEGEYSNSQGNHINGLEGFWGILKRQLAAKGGIRRERLPLYLAEYVWKFNHRKWSSKLKENRLLQLLENQAINYHFSG
jgi:transposase